MMMKKTFFILLAVSLFFSACNTKQNKMADNPFFAEYGTPFEVPDFSKIKTSDYIPAFEEGIKEHAAEIDAIANNEAAPTFENTLEAMDKSGALLDRVSSVFYNQFSANTNDELKAINKEIAPKLAAHSDNINLNAKLFERVKTIYDEQKELNMTTEAKNEQALNTEQTALLDKVYNGFVRGGANLNDEDQAKMREINGKLALLYPQFGENVVNDRIAYKLVIDNEKDLSGLPESVKDAAAEAATEAGMEGKWVFTLDKPSWIPFLQYADNRELRKEIYTAWMNQGNNNNANDNKENIKEILKLRLQKAQLLGYKTFADYAIDNNMAKTPENVMTLLTKLWDAALPMTKQEAKELQAIADKEGDHIILESWDWWYYTEKLRKEKYALEESELRPYFSLANVQAGAYELVHRIYGLKMIRRSDIPVYHEDVEAWEVQEENGDHVGILLVDYFPRASKRGGAWMSSYRKQMGAGDDFVSPVIVNVGNFTKPTANEPSLLSIDEVQTLFHEFGHGLHGLLSNVKYNTISGTSVKRDFVELPSQIMENWALEPEMLKIYAKHYKTGEAIPDELIAKIQKSSQFNQGFITTEYLAASLLDIKYHMIDNVEDIDNLDVLAFEKQTMSDLGLIDEIIPRYRSTYFNHSFGGEGYSAGYYVYIWAAVLDSDAYQAFVENGIFDRATGDSFRKNVISKGGSDEPMTLYKNFRGADPSIEPLLKKRGLK
ncbi:MAG: M3 family metallopeptidase [Bacteroidales bacterium]|nr:M3 family metallopeptidase [Bacteroidales bacterium]